MLYYDKVDVSERIYFNNQKSVTFVTINIFYLKGLSFNWMFAVVVMIYLLCLQNLAILLL